MKRKNWKVPIKFLDSLESLYKTIDEIILIKEKQKKYSQIKGLKSFNSQLFSSSKEKQYHKQLLKQIKNIEKYPVNKNQNVKKAGLDDRDTLLDEYIETIEKIRDHIRSSKENGLFPWSFLRYENHAEANFYKLKKLKNS